MKIQQIKKAISVTVASLMIGNVVGVFNDQNDKMFDVDGTNVNHVEYFNSIPYKDDFNFSTYEIIDSENLGFEVADYEVYGVAIDSKDSVYASGSDVFLDTREIDADLQAGDKVMVIFENGYDDVIVDVVEIN